MSLHGESSRGRFSRGGRSRFGGRTQMVRPLVPHLTHLEQGSPHEAENPDSPRSPSSLPSTLPTPSIPASVAIPVEHRVDDEGRIIIAVSEFQQFTGGVPSPSRWFTRLLHVWTWSVCSRKFKLIDIDVKNTWWDEFKIHYAWPGYSDEQAKVVFWDMMQTRYREFIYDTKEKYYKNQLQPKYFPDHVWAGFVEYWESDEGMKASDRGKRNRASADGNGSKHTTGSISIAEHHARMTHVHGNNVDYSDVFASTHTTMLGADELPKWVDGRAEMTFGRYRAAVQAEVDEGRLDQNRWSPQIWQDVASQGRKKRGKRVYGFGEHGAAAIFPVSQVSQESCVTARSHSTGLNTEYTTLQRRLEMFEQSHERLQAENDEIRLENARMRAQMDTFIQNFLSGSLSHPPPTQDR